MNSIGISNIWTFLNSSIFSNKFIDREFICGIKSNTSNWILSHRLFKTNCISFFDYFVTSPHKEDFFNLKHFLYESIIFEKITNSNNLIPKIILNWIQELYWIYGCCIKMIFKIYIDALTEEPLKYVLKLIDIAKLVSILLNYKDHSLNDWEYQMNHNL